MAEFYSCLALEKGFYAPSFYVFSKKNRFFSKGVEIRYPAVYNYSAGRENVCVVPTGMAT